LEEILNLGPGSVVELDNLVEEPVDIKVNGKLVAKGEIVVVEEKFGVKITDIVEKEERVKKAL
jgi:flagellar motor switch protein FliN/FliY